MEGNIQDSIDSTTGIVYHKNYLLHQHSPTHPERRERLMYTMDQLEEEGIFDLPQVKLFEPEKATEEELLRVHDRDYLRELEASSKSNTGTAIDQEGETIIQEITYEQSKLAAGGTILGGEIVLDEEVDHSFVMARPGGHHAFRDHGHGFCFTNNISIAIKHMQEVNGVDKVLVWDWDAHHFDGTQSIFLDDPSVLTVSTHQNGKTLFPGTGFVGEVGSSAGEGFNVNVPIPPHTSDNGYLKVVEEIFVPVAREFDPDLMVLQAGQDNHFTDPITDLDLTARGYSAMMRTAVKTAREICDDKIVAILGGGYGIEGGLPYTNLAVIAALTGLDTSNIREPQNYERPDSDAQLKKVNRVVKKVREVQSDYWEGF